MAANPGPLLIGIALQLVKMFKAGRTGSAKALGQEQDAALSARGTSEQNSKTEPG